MRRIFLLFLEFKEFEQLFVDFEQRRFVVVNLPSEDDEGRTKTLTAMKDEANRIALDHISNVPSGDVADHKCLYCKAVYMRIEYIPFDKFNPPSRIETVMPSHLVEVRRLVPGIDVCIRDIGTDKKLGFEKPSGLQVLLHGGLGRGNLERGDNASSPPRWPTQHVIHQAPGPE